MTKERTFLLTGILLIIIVSVFIIGIPSREEYYNYSLFGWRTQPPYEYPQKTINTPYDIIMRDCTGKCFNNKTSIADCQKSCQLAALQMQGVPKSNFKERYNYNSSNSLYEHPPPNVCSRNCVNSFSNEIGFSHGSSRNRIINGTNCFNW